MQWRSHSSSPVGTGAPQGSCLLMSCASKNRRPLLPHIKALLADCSCAVGHEQKEKAPMRLLEPAQEEWNLRSVFQHSCYEVEVTQVSQMMGSRHPPACLMSRG